MIFAVAKETVNLCKLPRFACALLYLQALALLAQATLNAVLAGLQPQHYLAAFLALDCCLQH